MRRILVATDGSPLSLKAARSGGCDLIVMGSHGRGGVQRALIGSETAKVLVNGTVPVLVCR